MNFNYGNGNIHWMDTPGKRIKAHRTKVSKLTQITLAAMTGIDQSTISDIENDKGLSAEYLIRICDALDLEPRYVMRGTTSAGDVLQKIKALVSNAQNENLSLVNVSNEGKPPIEPTTKRRTLVAVKAIVAPQLNPVVRRKLVSKGASNERSASKTKKKPRDGKTS